VNDWSTSFFHTPAFAQTFVTSTPSPDGVEVPQQDSAVVHFPSLHNPPSAPAALTFFFKKAATRAFFSVATSFSISRVMAVLSSAVLVQNALAFNSVSSLVLRASLSLQVITVFDP